jgi:hypothetical protein
VKGGTSRSTLAQLFVRCPLGVAFQPGDCVQQMISASAVSSEVSGIGDPSLQKNGLLLRLAGGQPAFVQF